MSIDIIWIVVGLVGLFFGGDWLVKGASRIAKSLDVSPLIIGLTIVSVGTSAPELLVSVQAALDGVSDIAVGNVIGSNIANIGLILGISGVIAPIAVQLDIIRRAIPILVLTSIFTYILAFNNTLSRLDGTILLLGFVGYNILYYFLAKREHDAHLDHPHDHDDVRIPFEVVRLVAGIALLVIGADRLVLGATSIARSIGVSELVIGVTMVAFGTSLPELATSIVASWQKQSDIIIGNVIGSNIANLLLILGTTSLIRPIAIEQSVIEFEFIIMLGFTLLVFPFALNRILSRYESAAFIIAYLVFILWVFL